MQPITLLGLVLCLGVLFWKATNAAKTPRAGQKRNLGRIFRTAKILAAALLALLGISFQLRQVDHSLDHKTPYEKSSWERMVERMTK